MDQKEFDAILKSHKHTEESPGDIAERIIGMGQPKRTIGGTLKDIGVTTANAAIGAGEAVVGLADLATGGMAGKGLSQLGYDPKAARNFLQQYKSEAQQAADRRVDEAKGFGGTLKAYLRNPSTIVEAGAESLPSMFLGGGIGRGIGAAGKAAGILSKPAARAGLLGAIGEGVVGAGSAAEQIRQETGELTGTGAASAIGSGIGTGVLGRLGNKLAPKLGAVDIEEALVRGFSGNARNVPLSFGKTLKAITGGAISEGAFEELPQSIQEQVWQNYATGKPLMEGVPEGAAQGLVTGAAMGGAVNIHSALPGQQRKALAELEQKRQARLAQEHDKLVREATRGQVALQAATGQNLPGVSSAGLNFDGGRGLPPGVAPYMAGQNASTFDLMREQQQRQAQTALDLEQRQQAAREQVLQQERIQNQLAANGFGYAPGQRAAVHGAPDEMASALAGETEEEYQQRLGNLEQRRQQGQQGLINVLQNRVDMQRQNAQATAGAIAKAAQAAKQQEDEQAQRDRFDQWAAAERAAGRDVGPFSMDEQQQAKATSSGPLGKAVAKGFGALNEAERAVEYGRIFDRGATNTQAIEQIQAERERAFLGDGESSDAGFPEFRQELAANRRERVAQGLPATLTPDAKAAATIEGVGFRQQPGSKLPPELDYQVSRMEAQLQESITGTHEANVDQNGDTVWLKGKGYWPQWMEKKTMPRGKWAKQGTQEREDQAEDLKNANILHDAGRDKILAVIDKARKGVALGSHEKSIWSAVERIASQPGGPALWGQSDMLIADANEAAANERMQARYGLSMLPKPMTVRVADIEPGETLAVDGMVEDAVGKTVLYTHKGIDAQGNTIMERGEHDAVTGKTGAARVMRFEPTDHLEGVIGVRERADREQNPNRTTKAYNREGKAFRSIEKQGIAITEPQNIPVDMLRPGDRVVIRDPQGMPDVATMRGYDSNNRAVIRDGIEYHLQADDNITVEGLRAKGEVRQTKGFGYRPKNERQQIAREYEQDRQERAERSEILREAKTQVRGELTNTLRQIAGKRRIHAEEQRALATQANKRQQAGADSKQGTPQAVMPKGSRPTVSLGYGFHPGDNTPTLERARAQKQEQKENRKTFPGTQYETGEQRVRENRRNFPATKYETGKPGRIEREAFARPTGYQQVKPAADALRENKRQSGLARQQEGEARPQGIIRGGTDNDRALAHEQYQAVLDFAAGKLRRENAGLSTREARRQAVQQLGLEEKAVPETGWWRERASKSPGYLANLLSKSAAKRTKTHVEHSSGSNPYFLSTEKSTIVPLKDLLSSEPKLDAARVDRARANMDAAAAGTGAKRKPLPVYRRSDGKLVALDGNSTLAVLRERGEKSAIVEIKKTIKQPRATLDEIYADAAKADVVLRKSLADFVERTGGRLVSRPDGQIKSRERAEQKARQDSTPRKLKDIVAHTLVYPDQKTLMQALPQFEKEYGPIELKNRFENPPDSGYRDILANVRVKEADGHIAEIQLTTKAMLQAKEGLGHKIYEVQRELDDIAKRTSNAEATELALEFDKISKEYYEAADQSSSSSKSATARSSALFRLTLSPDLNKTLARASELLVSMNSSPNIRKSVLDLESSLKGVPSQSKYRSSMESSPVAEEKSSGSGENIQQKAAQSEENQAPAGKTEAREAVAPGKSEVPVILPPGNLKNEKIEITKRGRKWLKGKRVGKNYEIKIEINDVSRDWQAGQTVEFPAHVEVEQSKYGITTTSYPLTAEQVAQARVQAVLPDIKRWLGYVEEKAHEGHVYQNGVQKLRELGIASLPEYQKRLDAALASVKERKEAEATREVSEGRTWLRVPYADKDHAKKHGARFDGDRKQWYVIGKDVPEALEQYLPDDSGGGRPNDKRPGNGQPEQKEAGQYTISNGSGYGGSPYKTGETIRSNRKDLPEYVTVIRASQRYYGEDGMSFGVGDDSGYVYTATVREATREEAAPVRAREEAKKARKQAKEMLLSIAREIRENGDRPELQGAPAGVRIDMPGNPENIHGGGEWFIIGQDRVWHVRNNGADGDDWSANNIRTGGAGAIGFAIPFDRGLAGRLVGALEAAGADIPQAARKLTEGESGPRESRAAGGDVVATLNGEEVLSATGETIFEKARNYYRDNLQGKDVYREGLGAVRVTGKGWGKLKRGLKTDELKARLIPGIPALIRDGAIGAREPVIREDGIVAFYHITGNVRIGDEIVQAGISVGEDGFGNLFYNMNHDTEVLWEKRKARLLPRSEAGGGEPSTDKGLSMKKSIGDQTGFVNLHVLGRAEERQTKALPESERADIEGELITAIGKLQTRRLFGSIGQVKILDTQEDAQRVIASGHIVKTEVRHSKGGAIQGITMPDGQVYLVRDGIAKGQAMPVLLHELGEHAAQLGFKDMQYRAILRSLERQAKDDSETGRAIRKGIARARAAGVRPDNKYYWSEVAAYTIEENADVRTSLLDRIVNYFKGLFLKVCGVQAGKFSHKDLVMFAKAAVKAAARRGAQFGKYDPQKSLWSADESQTGLRSISEALAQREYDEVVKRYKGTAQWLKAPNGKPSNLNERQWVQVRTPSFKKWFGDWETALHLKNTATFIDQVAAGKRPADLSIGFVGGKEAGKIKQLTGVNTKGRSFKLVADDIAHALKSHGQQERESARGQVAITAEDLKLLPIVLGQPSSIVAGSTQNGRQSVRFEKKIDGTLVVVEIVPSAGSSVQFKTAWKRPSETADAFSPSHTSETDPSPPRSYNERIQQLLTQSNASVVIDANGEPLVVYHGSGEQRNIITPGMRDPGAWFTSNFRNAANYAKGDEPIIHDTFLAIKNPLVVTFDYGEDGDLVPFINSEAVNIDNNVDLVKYAQRYGYDGVHFPEGNFTEEDDTWVAFQEEQIKSATDNTGDFDSENPDIRYSFAGEKGAAALDAADETTVRMDNKGIAEDMEAAGKDAKAIKYATGWERGKDGKWRYETNDSTASFDASKIAEYGDTKLSEALDAPDLFRAYPQLRNTLIKTGYNMQGAAAYNYVTNSIMVKDGVTLDKATTLHEVQHAIQEIEGFARGGNPQEFMNRAAMGKTRQGLQKKTQAESDYREAVRRFAEKHLPQYLNEWTDVDVGEGGKFSEPYNLLGQDYESIADLTAGVADAMVEQGMTPEHGLAEIFQGVPGKFQGIDGAFHEFLESEGLYAQAPGELAEIAERWREQGKAASEDLAKMTDRANEDYMALAGESEARNVARRMNMSAEQRRNSPAEETEDVAREDQIVQERNDGAAESREDITNQAKDYGRRIREAAAKWASVVDQAIKDIQRNKKPSKPLEVGPTPDLLVQLGIPDLRVVMGLSVVNKIMFKKHGLTAEQTKALYEEMSDPVAVVRYGEEDYAVVTGMKKGDSPIIVGLNVGDGHQIHVNTITSAYGKDGFKGYMIGKAQDGQIVYLDKKKLAGLVERTIPGGDISQTQFLGGFQQDLQRAIRGKIKYPSDVVKPQFEESAPTRTAGEITTLFQTAYHGSPYRFSGFTLENIGGGEGAQVHGWGLYFALDRDVSEGYLAKLGDDNPAYKTIYGSGVKTNDGWIWADESDPENGWTLPSGSADDIALEAMEDAGGVQKDAISALEERLEDLRDDIDLELEEGEELEDALKENEEYQNVLEALGFLRDVEYERTSSGQLYEVDIPDDDVMLREDAALEEQPEQVREAVKKLFAEHGLDLDDAGNGREIYEKLARTLGGDEDASRALNEAGVKGIRYDGRDDGECAVVFDDKAIEILDTFYQAEAQGSLDDVLKQLYGQIMKSGESRNARTPWTEKTSKAIIMGPHGSARKSNESLYRAAKEGGDPKAAYELVAPLVTKEGVDAIRAKLRDVTSAVVVPVVSEERLGRNKMPRAYADILADRLGAQVAVDIVHINKVNRSGSDGFHRLAAQPEFDGAVEAGREYIIVDDTLAQGGTLASLKGYIEQKGGRVVAISALTGKDYSAKLRPNTADLELLRKKYPELEAFWYEEFGYGFDRLTSSEANYLCTVKGHTFDTIRDRILAERRQGGASNHSGSDSTGQSGGPVSGSLDSKSHFPSFKSAGKGDGANPSSNSGHSSSRTRFQQVREQINRILPNKDEAKAIIAIIEARAFSAGLTPEEFVTKRGLTFVDAELPVNPQGKLLEKMMGGQLRGAFNVRDYVEEGRAIITAFRGNANVSTLAHELGHLFRQDLKRYGQDRLLAMAEHWAGVKNGRWNREQEEKFARGFEAYLLEGKAPTTAMGKVFERFRVWISRLYGALVDSQLNVGLDDEIRSVFDALLTEHAAEDAGDAFAEGIAKTRARIAELEGSGPIDLDHRTLFQIGLADSGGAGNTFTGWTSAINRIMSSHPKWRDRWERFIYNMVDTNDPRERIWKAAGSPDAQDIVTVERLRGKKAAAEQKTFRDGMVTPLLKSMAAAGLKASDLEEYAHAMHAPERNQRMREVNAKRVLESLLRQMPAKDADEYRELINLAQSGLRQGWNTTDVQRFYLDQMQKIFNDLSAREQQCNALARTATSNAAQQRVAKMQEQVAESYRIRDKWRTESQRFAGITDGEAQSIVAKWRQDKRFAAIEDARQQLSAISRATLDTLHEAGELGDEEYQALRNGYQYYVPLHRDGFQDTRPATGRVTGPTGRPFKVAKGSMLEVVNILPEVIRAHETAINRKHKLEAGRALYEFALAHPDAGITVEKQEQMPTHDREGNIVMYTRQTEPEDGVFVKVDGKRYLLRFEADVRTPEGRTLARFLDSIKGQDAQLGGITKSLHKITRLLAAVNTSLSPEFVVSNFSRDLQTALIHLNQEDINMQGLQSQVLKSVGKAVRGIWLAERGKPGNNEMARWYRDFEKNGGKVGWVQNYDGIEDLSKKLAGEMKLYEPGNRARKITRAVLDFIDAGNVAIENALRLATYKTMVEKGIDRAKAAGIASNLTVDFTRKGKLSPQINALYMFFNASVQGSYRMAKALATSPRVRKIAGGIAASGFLLQMLALAGGGDDDSDEPYVLGLPDSTRERYILIPMPGQDGRFFKFPKAYGYGALYDLGAEVANSMYMGMTGRQYNHAKGAMRVVSSFANSFNPIQSATILQTIAPTLVDPFVYVGENTNWTGLPLRPAQNNFGPKKPESGRAWKNTNPIYKSIAEGVNSLTGGDRYESGLVDISPEVFEMAVNTALGGLGRFIGNTAALPLATAKGELDAEKIPFVRQVYTKWDDRALSNRYYEAMERAQIARMRFKNAETLAEKRSIFDSPEYKIWRQSNATDKQVKRLRARLNRMEAAGNTVGADYLRKQIVGLQSKVLSTIM